VAGLTRLLLVLLRGRVLRLLLRRLLLRLLLLLSVLDSHQFKAVEVQIKQQLTMIRAEVHIRRPAEGGSSDAVHHPALAMEQMSTARPEDFLQTVFHKRAVTSVYLTIPM
jgi:hypothetical protein